MTKKDTGYLVTSDNDGSRVDRFVRNLFKDVNYVFLQKLFRQGKIKVNNKRAKASQRLNENDRVDIYSDQLMKVSNDSKSKIEEFSEVEIGEMCVDKIILKKSTLTPQGPIYDDIRIFEL